MSRTTLCALTAGVLAMLSVAVMMVRQRVMGDELRRPRGPAAWKVTLAVRGVSLGNARLVTAMPLDLDRQQVYNDAYESEHPTGALQEPAKPCQLALSGGEK